MAMLLPFLAMLAVPPGLDARHIPQGSPLGAMPIVAAPGESTVVLQAPLTEKQWLAERRALIARSAQNPHARRIAERLAAIAREEAARESEAGPR